jgi:hypothetical protein
MEKRMSDENKTEQKVQQAEEVRKVENTAEAAAAPNAEQSEAQLDAVVGGTTPKSEHGDLVIPKLVDMSSPKL